MLAQPNFLSSSDEVGDVVASDKQLCASHVFWDFEGTHFFILGDFVNQLTQLHAVTQALKKLLNFLLIRLYG